MRNLMIDLFITAGMSAGGALILEGRTTAGATMAGLAIVLLAVVIRRDLKAIDRSIAIVEEKLKRANETLNQ